MTLLLNAKNLKKSYSGKEVVSDFSFQINEGEVVGLLGPNGAGKTTAFYLTIGLIKQDSGEIFFKDKEISKLPIHKRAEMGMGYLAQEPSIFRTLSVEDNIMCILELLPICKKEQKEKLEFLIHDLNLKQLRKKIACTLSGGERRRLEIARALATSPSLLLLDEPFANIDPITIQQVKELISILKKKNISVLITDHNAREIFSVVERSYLMQYGKVILSGNVSELVNNDLARKYYLGEHFSL